MPNLYLARRAVPLVLTCGLAACGGGTGGTTFQPGLFDPAGVVATVDPIAQARASAASGTVGENAFIPAGTGNYGKPGNPAAPPAPGANGTIWENFTQQSNPNVTVQVNKYIWRAALETLDFLPIESIDPFTGVIVTGYGTPPGGGRAYRATIYIQDAALDARSLHVALQTKGGVPVSDNTARAIEDAILNRARQLRIADAGY